ncbi:putative ribonuclease H-like domain-containing protein [Tanacetum coccineum]
MGHFARECKAPRSQDRGKRESYRKDPMVEESGHKAMMAIDGIGWDWSFMANEEEASKNQALVAEEVVPTKFALMAKSSSSSDNEVYDDSYCSKSCRKNTENLTTKISKLNEKKIDSESDLCNYKRGLSQVEARLVEFKVNEAKFCEKIRVLERDLELKDYRIENLTIELEEVKKERDGIDSKLEKFVNSSKNLDQMLESQKSGKDKKGVGFDEYCVVPPPSAQVYSPPKPDLSWTCLPEFVDDIVTDYSRPTSSVTVTNDELDGNNVSVYEHGGTSRNVVSKPMINFVKESDCPSVTKVNNIENARRPFIKYAKMYRHTSKSPKVKGNQRNWNNHKSQQLGKDFLMQNKACYNCGSFDHLVSMCLIRVDNGESRERVNYITTHKSMTPRAVLLKTGIKPTISNKHIPTVRHTLNIAPPKMTSFHKSAYLNVKIPFKRNSVAKYKVWVPTDRTKVPTVSSKVPTAEPTVATNKGNKGKVVKASARWIWKPKQNTNQGSNANGVSGKLLDNIEDKNYTRLKTRYCYIRNVLCISLKYIEDMISNNLIDDKGFWDSGCSRHVTGNISYLSDFEPYDGGYVSFGYGGGKITGKGIIKTGKLEFENMHFVKELKYNLFSVSQICDNKNSVLFTDSVCIVLGRDFKLEDDRHVLLRTPRQQNMYVVDLKDIVPHENLTCLIAKASIDESMLWNRRVGHLNFKIMNKLVRNNLVTGLPSKIFENDHSCADCLKEKQHRASCKSKLVNSVSKPLFTLHMDLFGSTSISSLNHKWYCLVMTDDFSSFSWTFFLKSKDETFKILRNFITEIENLKDLKVEHEENKEVLKSSGISIPIASPKESSELVIKPQQWKLLFLLFITPCPTDSENIFTIEPSEPLQTPTVLCLFSCFLSQIKPKKVADALNDESWVEAMQEELLQFKIQNVMCLG